MPLRKQDSGKQKMKTMGNFEPKHGRYLTKNKTLRDFEIDEDIYSQAINIFTTFEPSPWLTIDIDTSIERSPVEYQRNPKRVENALEDFVEVFNDVGILDGEVRLFNSLTERSGDESPFDSYYFQTKGGVDTMTVEGDGITEEEIRSTAEDLISHLKSEGQI